MFSAGIISTVACDVIPNPVGVPDQYFAMIASAESDQPAFLKLSERVIFESIPGRSGHHGATLAMLEEDRLVCAWYSYRGPEELDDASIFVSEYAPEIDRWSTPAVVPDLPNPAANPLLISSGERLHLLFAHAPLQWWSSSVWLTESDDAGRTWSSARPLPLPAGANLRNPPIQLADGTTILPAYSDFWLNALMLRATGMTSFDWQVEAVYGPNDDKLLQPSVVELSNGMLLMAGRNRGGGKILYATSSDRGARWSQARRGVLPNPDSALLLMRLRDGRHLLLFNDSAEARTPLVAMLSVDDGISWRGRTILADGEGAFSYPSAIQMSDDVLHITFTRNRERIVHQVWCVTE